MNMPGYANCFFFSRPSRFVQWMVCDPQYRSSFGYKQSMFEHLCYIIPIEALFTSASNHVHLDSNRPSP